MELKLVFGILSAIVAVLCFIPYFRDIFKKRAKPHAYTWLLWSILQTIGVLAQLKEGAGYGVLALAIGAFFCFSIFLLSIKFGTKNITKFDTACLVAALLAIVFYVSLRDPLWSVILVTIIDLVAFLPTVRKAYSAPWTETMSTYALSGTSTLLSIIALQSYSVSTVLYLASLLVTNWSFVLILFLRRKTINHQAKK